MLVMITPLKKNEHSSDDQSDLQGRHSGVVLGVVPERKDNTGPSGEVSRLVTSSS